MLDVGEAFGQVDAAVELAQDFVFDLAGDLDVVNLLDAVTWVGEAVCQLTIVRNNDLAFRCHVESTDAKYARCVRRHEVGNSRTAGRVASCRYDSGRLVYGEVG